MASKYDRIAGDLRTQIRSGAMSGQLPPETELATRYRVALNTLRRALDVLEGEGLVSSQQGTGTFVRPPRQRVRRNHAERYQWEKDRARLTLEERRATGATEKDTGLSITDLDFSAVYATIEAPEILATRFGVEVGTPLLQRVYRTRAKSEVAPLSLVTSYLVVDMISRNPDLLSAVNEPWPGGTQSQLHSVGIEIDRIDDELTARPPYADEAQELDLEPGIAVIVLWKTSVDIIGRVVELSEVILPGDRTQIEYTTQLKRW
jgi:GntR family transcriptional regulator